MQQIEKLMIRRSDGSAQTVIVPRSRVDVEQQPDVPAYALAVLAFASRIDGRLRWSDWTRATLARLSHQYGDDNMRRVLCALLDEINAGFKPTNPIGLLIHRLRITADSGDLTI